MPRRKKKEHMSSLLPKVLHKLFINVMFSMMVLATSWSFVASAEAAIPPDVVERRGEKADVMLHYPERFEKGAKKLDEQAVVSLTKLQYRLGIEQMPRIDVWLVSDLDDYFIWNAYPGRAPEWAIGLSLVDRHTVLVRHGLGPNRQLVDIHDTFDHELAHVAIDVAREGHPVPRWFNEGFASYHAGEWTLERGEEVARAAATGSLIPFKELERTFPDHAQITSVAYAQSHHFIRFMAKRYGEDVFGKLIDRMREHGESFSVAFTMVTGDDFEVQESNWRSALTQNSSPLSNLADGTPLFFGASLLFLIAWFVRRRRTRKRFEHLDDYLEGWDADPSRYKLPHYHTQSA